MIVSKTSINKQDHIRQWKAFKDMFIARRGSDAGRNNKAIPRTTHGDIKQLVKYWHNEYLSEVLGNPRALDKDLASRRRWIESKRTIDRQLAGADPNAVYPANAWFWDDVTTKLSIYLESRKAIPTRAQLLVEAFEETIDDKLAAVKDTIDDIVPDPWSLIKRGVLVLGGLTGAAIALPPVIRALKRKPELRR